MLQDAFANDCYEVSQVYKSFTTIRGSFDQALKAFKSGNSTEALLKYSQALTLYKKVNNYNIAGIICNNIGNIHLKLNRVDEAIEKYKEAIEMGDKSSLTKPRSKITRKMNLAVALREKFYQEIEDVEKYFSKGHLFLGKKSRVKDCLLSLEDICSELLRYFKEEDHYDMVFTTKYCLMLCLIYSELGNKRRSEHRMQDAQNYFKNFKEEKKIWQKKRKFSKFEQNKVFLIQEM